MHTAKAAGWNMLGRFRPLKALSLTEFTHTMDGNGTPKEGRGSALVSIKRRLHLKLETTELCPSTYKETTSPSYLTISIIGVLWQSLSKPQTQHSGTIKAVSSPWKTWVILNFKRTNTCSRIPTNSGMTTRSFLSVKA